MQKMVIGSLILIILISQVQALYVPGELIVKFKSPAMAEIKPRMGPSVVKVEAEDMKKAALELMKNPYVEYAEPNYIFRIDFTPNDRYFDDQWAHDKIASELAWDIEQGEVVIAILDTGVETHEDLEDNLWYNKAEILNSFDDDGNGYVDDMRGYDFVNDDNDPDDDNNHGTHCAGIAAARGNNAMGVSGVCPRCKIMSLKMCNSNGFCYTSWAVPAIYYAADNGAKVISMSWYADDIPVPQSLKEAIDYAYSRGVVLIAAAGNDNEEPKDTFPAGYENVVTVAATDQNDEKAYFSNFGGIVDVAAPGVRILSTVRNGYAYWAGTSMATPHVAGLAGLLFSAYPDLSNEEVIDIIKSEVDPVPPTPYIGTGRINAYKALQWNCTPEWVLNDTWTECFNSLQSTNYFDLNECGKEQPPAITRACNSCINGVQDADEGGIDCGGVCVKESAELCNGIDDDDNCQIDEGCATDITIHSPKETEYNMNRIWLNVTVDSKSTIKYKITHNRTLCSECLGRLRRLTLRDGKYNLTVYADGYEKSVSFIVDYKKPRITKQSPASRKFANGRFKVSYVEEHPLNVTLFYGNESLSRYDCPEKSCEFLVNLSKYDGQVIEYHFVVADYFAKDSYRSYTVTADTTPSFITLHSPLDQVYQRRIPFNITLSEKAKYLRYSDNGNRFRTLCNMCDEYGFSRLRMRSFRQGQHNLTIVSIDDAGNEDSVNVSFWVE